ncbi:MAG: hypothetical protein ACRDC7_10915 [Aeromonas veronii]
MTTITQAQAQAANLCLTVLTDAGLIGDNLVTKLPAARAAIMACLPKMYAACRQVEAETGKNMHRVHIAVMQMYGRAKWADHDKMMDAVEAGLRALIVEEEAKVEEAPVDVAIYFQGTQKGERGPAIGLKHVTTATDINAAMAEAVELFDIAGGVRAFINGVEVNAEFAAHCLEEVSKEEAAKAAKVADLVQRIESRLKAEAIDFMNEADAVASLSECVAPTLLVRIYQEELAKRREAAFGLRVGRLVHTPVGMAEVDSFDRHHVGEVKIRFVDGSGYTTTHYSKLIPC